MPYISQEMRKQLIQRTPKTVGELNYLITKLVNDYLEESKVYDKGMGRVMEVRYHNYNEAIGVLECAKLELYRRMVAPYEDEAIEKNGDVYTIRSSSTRPEPPLLSQPLAKWTENKK